MSDPESERAWALSAQAGSADAFSRLVAAHQYGLRVFLRRLCANYAEADDLAQDTFVFAWEHIARFDSGRPFRPWLFAIGWRKMREHKRSWLRLVRREQNAARMDDAVMPDLGLGLGLGLWLGLDLKAAMGRLPPPQRAAVLLCLGEDFTHAEAAAILELPLGTIKSHVARGREKLAAALGDSNG